MAYKVAKILITAGRTVGLADKLSVLFLNGMLSEIEYSELIGLIPVE